jgi:DNA-binding NarL/FixJ family response regulator
MKGALRTKDEELLHEPRVDLLTDRQREILNLVSLGHTNREIATILKISVRTVEVHRFHLMRRLNVRNVAQLFGRALALGLVPPCDRRARSRDDRTSGVLQFPGPRQSRRKSNSKH